jgi:hypothetical protein
MTRIACLVGAALLAIGCSEASTELIPARAQVTRDGAADDSGTGTQLCGGGLCQCNNLIDEDNDGLIDSADPECTGPFDDDESSFATGLPTGLDFCQDCYWDSNTEGDDDGCAYHTDCLFGDTPSGGATAACSSCEVSPQCADTCRDLTRNGCDCFGCCTVFLNNGTSVDVLLSDSCRERDVQNEDKCPRCVQDEVCRNECGECELCPGRKRRDLPVSCRGMPSDEEPMNRCDEGQDVCDADRPCPPDFYCQLGCCVYIEVL